MNSRPLDPEALFDRESCDRCGICFSQCPEMGLPIEIAREEIDLAIKGRPRYVLDRCTSCRVCNALCPNDCNPWGLVSTLRNYICEGRGVSSLFGLLAPHFPPNVFTALREKLPARDKEVLEKWASPEGGEEVFFAGNNSLLFPYLYDSRLLEDMPVLCGEKLDAGAFYAVPGYMDPASQVLGFAIKTLKKLGARRVICETDAYDMLSKHDLLGLRMDLELVHISQWLRQSIDAGKISITSPLRTTLTVHDNCMSRDFLPMMDEVRELVSMLGGELVEMQRTRERAPCCGLGGSSRAFSLPDMLAQMVTRLGEAEDAGAEGLVVYCTGCLWALSMARVLSGSSLPVYHIFELVRMASGEDSLQDKHAERAWQIIGVMADGVLSDLLKPGEKRMFIDDVPLPREMEFAYSPQPFPIAAASGLMDKPLIHAMVAGVSALVMPAFTASYLGRKRLLFAARVRAGAIARALISSPPVQALKKALPAPADIFYQVGTRENNRIMGVLKKTLIRRIPMRYVTRLGGRPIISVPCAAPVNKSLGRTFEQATNDAQVNFDTVNQMVKMFKSDMLLGVIDGSIEPHACGCEVAYPEIGVPYVTTHPAPNIEELEKLIIPDPGRDGRLPQMMEAIRLISGRYKITCGCAVGGPLTIACELGGAENVASSIITDPEYVTRLLSYTTEVCKTVALTYVEAGADAVLIGEPTGSMLSRKHAWEFMGKYVKEVIDACPVPMILHICGNTDHLIELMVRTGPDAISVDKGDLPSLVPRIPSDIIIVGNIDPIAVLEQGTPQDIKREVKDLCSRMSHVPYYLCAPGCDISPDTPLENLAAMIDAVRELG